MIWVAVVIGVLIFGFIAVCLPHNIFIKQAQRESRALPTDVRDAVLAAIAAKGRANPGLTLLRPQASDTVDEEALLTESHFLGAPYAESGESWPALEDGSPEPAPFLMQVRLRDPLLGPSWEERLIAVFLKHDVELTVRSYGKPSPERYVKLVGGPDEMQKAIPLEPIPLPKDESASSGEDGEFYSFVPVFLVSAVPEIGSLLGSYTDDTAGVLTQILMPGHYGTNLEMCDIAYSGGEPCFIQREEEFFCPECGDKMRYLFQCGDIIPNIHLGDAGTFYVFGCDRHPARCSSVVQMF